MNLDLLESWLNLQAQHAICFAFCKSCKCIFVGRQCDDHNGTICISNNWSNYTFSKFMIKVWIESLCNVEACHNPGFGFGNILKCIFEMGKEYAI